jgi:type IV secretory pathway protease TraF
MEIQRSRVLPPGGRGATDLTNTVPDCPSAKFRRSASLRAGYYLSEYEYVPQSPGKDEWKLAEPPHRLVAARGSTGYYPNEGLSTVTPSDWL